MQRFIQVDMSPAEFVENDEWSSRLVSKSCVAAAAAAWSLVSDVVDG